MYQKPTPERGSAPPQDSILKKVHLFFQREQVMGYTLIAPAFLLLGVLVAWPFDMALALLLFRAVTFKKWVRGAVLLPWVIPTALSTLGWWWMFDSLYS